MEDALLMSDMEGIGNLHGHARGVLRRHRPTQRRPFQEFQDEIPRPDRRRVRAAIATLGNISREGLMKHIMRSLVG